MDHKSNGDTIGILRVQYSYQRIGKRTGGLGNKRTSGDHSNYCVVEIGKNIKKSPVDLWRLALTQTPVKDHQLMLMWKNLKRVK